MDKVDCSVLYSETSQCLLIKADGSRTLGDVKLTAVREMQKQITSLVPGVELEPSYTDFYPAGMDDGKTLRELGSTTATVVVWPKSSSDGKNTNPVRDAIQSSRQQALVAECRVNSLELIAQEREETIPKKSKKSRSNQAKKPNDRIGQLEADNKQLKADIKQLNDRIDQLEADNKQLKADNKQLKGDNKQHDVSLKQAIQLPISEKSGGQSSLDKEEVAEVVAGVYLT